jgi:hypothetical protein
MAQPAMFSWQQPLAALFGGLSAAGQPGGFANFGAGVNQTMQQQQQAAQAQQMAELRDLEIQQQQQQMARANKEAADREARGQQLASLVEGGGIQTASAVRPVGNYGAATGGAIGAQQPGQPAMFRNWSPEQRAVFVQFARDNPDAAQQFMVEQQFAQPEQYEATSPIGKLRADLQAGLIDQQTYDALIKKETYIPPREGQGMTERQRNAVAAGLQPGSPEFQQYILGRDDTAPGPFQGTGLDAQSYNIVLMGDPASPEYAAAFAQLAMPKVTFDPVTQKMVSVAPDMSWARPPAGGAGPTAPTAPAAVPDQAGVETMQLPGATVTSTQGAPVYNETQGKAAGFADRMAEANAILEESAVTNAGQNAAQSSLSAIPIVGNALTSANRQKFEQAERNFINSQLRRESGAVISPEEFANARKQYIPQFGDSKQVLEQKKANRQSNIESMQRESGPFYKPKEAPADPNNPYSNMSDEEFLEHLKKRQGS